MNALHRNEITHEIEGECEQEISKRSAPPQDVAKEEEDHKPNKPAELRAEKTPTFIDRRSMVSQRTMSFNKSLSGESLSGDENDS